MHQLYINFIYMNNDKRKFSENSVFDAKKETPCFFVKNFTNKQIFKFGILLVFSNINI